MAMPVLDSGVIICEKCNRKFEWVYLFLTENRISDPGLYVVEEIPEGKVLAHTYQKNIDGSRRIEVPCPHCGYDNRFEIKGE